MSVHPSPLPPKAVTSVILPDSPTSDFACPIYSAHHCQIRDFKHHHFYETALSKSQRFYLLHQTEAPLPELKVLPDGLCSTCPPLFAIVPPPEPSGLNAILHFIPPQMSPACSHLYSLMFVLLPFIGRPSFNHINTTQASRRLGSTFIFTKEFYFSSETLRSL